MTTYIEKTQAELGAVISAPKLSEKLLSKPPFRFLHDIVTAFIKAASFPEGLFSADQLDSGKVTEKESKIEFLRLLISAVEAATGAACSAKPAKVIAGQEPEHTNQMLQLLASCAALPADRKIAAVQKAKGPEGPTAPVTEPVKEEPVKEKPEKKETEEERAKRKEEERAKRKEEERAKERSEKKETEEERAKRKEEERAKRKEKDRQRNEVPMDLPVNAVIRESGRDEGADAGADKDADWQKVAERMVSKPSANADAADVADVKGALGQQALKAKKEQEARQQSDAEGNTQARSGGIVIRSSMAAQRGGGAIGENELNRLREQLQMLTKASSPLGKFLEAIYDDIDSMVRELEMWRSESHGQALGAAEARRQTEESLAEVHAQLQNLEDAINDQIVKTNYLRQHIASNDAAMQDMVKMIVNPDASKN